MADVAVPLFLIAGRLSVQKTSRWGRQEERPAKDKVGEQDSNEKKKAQPPTASPQPSSSSFSLTTSKAKPTRRVGEQMKKGEIGEANSKHFMLHA